MSDIVGGKLCSKMGGGNLETARKNQRKNTIALLSGDREDDLEIGEINTHDHIL